MRERQIPGFEEQLDKEARELLINKNLQSVRFSRAGDVAAIVVSFGIALVAGVDLAIAGGSHFLQKIKQHKNPDLELYSEASDIEER